MSGGYPGVPSLCIKLPYIFIHAVYMQTLTNLDSVCISYVTSVRYVSGINHSTLGCCTPSGLIIYSGNVPNRGRDISNLCRHEPIAMVNGAKFLVLSP